VETVITGVVLDPDGAPVSFSYQGRTYLVSSRPVRWYTRRLWWKEAEGVPKGTGSAVMEVEMWRLWAVSDFDRIFLELRHLMPDELWEINKIGY
jgi:hypothetical protein